MKIAFYISDHGYGHASRCIPIINELLLNYSVNIIVKSNEEQIEFIKSLVADKNRVEFYKEKIDLGIILKDNSYEIDKEKLKNNVLDYVYSWESRIQTEIKFLEHKNVNIVISDIVPWIFKATNQLGIKSILISNFLWNDIYNEIVEKNIITNYQLMYELASYVFVYPLSTKTIENMENAIKVGFSVRNFDTEFSNRIRLRHNKPIIYFSLGRSVDTDYIINVEQLPYYFYYTEGINLIGENAIKISKNTMNTNDYIYASNLVITKAGWSTVAESICAKKPMLILNRSDNKEDINTINKLSSYGLINTFDFKDLFDKQKLKQLIEDTMKLEKNYIKLKFSKNDYKHISEKIIKIANEGM